MEKEFNTVNLTLQERYPYIEEPEYHALLSRFMASKINDTNDFIIGEALKIYAETEDNNIRLRILELLNLVRI